MLSTVSSSQQGNYTVHFMSTDTSATATHTHKSMHALLSKRSKRDLRQLRPSLGVDVDVGCQEPNAWVSSSVARNVEGSSSCHEVAEGIRLASIAAVTAASPSSHARPSGYLSRTATVALECRKAGIPDFS